MLRRPATNEERRVFVRTTWERSLTPRAPKDGMIHAGAAQLAPYVWAKGRRAIVLDAIDRPAVRVEVLDVEGQPLAWIVWEQDGARTVVHFMYTVPAVRRNGLAKTLLAPLLEQGEYAFAQMTKPGQQLVAACLGS